MDERTRSAPAAPSADARLIPNQSAPTATSMPNGSLPARSPGWRRFVLPLVAFAAIALGGASWLLYQSARTHSAPSALTASGTLEADEILIAPQVTGVITGLPVAEGSPVSEGAVVATLDDRVVQLQLQQSVGADPAAYEQLKLADQNYTLRSPITGVVTRVPTHVGELAVPGEALLTVAPIDHLKLTLYVREADLPRVVVGQQLAITADPYPNRAFSGQVTSINPQAEFTPRNVQTSSDRLNLVFGVQAVVTNLDNALRPGMPVEATFQRGGAP